MNAGDRFGAWTVVDPAVRERRVRCVCSCGREKMVNATNLRRGLTASCGGTAHKLVGLDGDRFGRLVVLAFDHGDGRRSWWRVRCDCGALSLARADALKRGAVTSCGCAHADAVTTHGMTGTAEHRAWQNMIDRCHNPNSTSWRNYGGRGITVCSAWRSDFESFVGDVGCRPSPRHSIDRIDNDGNYEPGNVRWATMRQQSRNRRTCRFVEYGGRRMPVAELAERVGMPEELLRSRLSDGWAVADAVALRPLTRSECGYRGATSPKRRHGIKPV